ncbi:hypothetical protein DVH05_012609 [Phytophthora capsici]|nr:hypothetical protein DVH05_012609 [Phytophthora capsici]
MHHALRRDHLQAALLMMQERDDNRRQELDEYPSVLPEGDNVASQSPIYDRLSPIEEPMLFFG